MGIMIRLFLTLLIFAAGSVGGIYLSESGQLANPIFSPLLRAVTLVRNFSSTTAMVKPNASTTPSTNTIKNDTSLSAPALSGQTKVILCDTEVLVDIADTDALREKGLSGRNTLKEGTGMLFVFETADRYGIWMKDMKFPIDIIWIDEAMHIVSIETKVAPSTYPAVFKPTVASTYVLELPSGFSSAHNLMVGGKIRIIEE